MKMKSTTNQTKRTKERMEFKGAPAKVKRAQAADDKSDKKLAKKYGVKWVR